MREDITCEKGEEEGGSCWVAAKRVALVVEWGLAGSGKASTGQLLRAGFQGTPVKHQ